MIDRELRCAVKKSIVRNILLKSTALLLEEFSVHHGAARIDLLVLNGNMHGYELKSDADTLDRLPDQARLFGSVFDRITLVTGYRHAYTALKIIPEWWGVKLAHVGPRGAIHLSDARSPKKNPTQDVMSIARLLWRDEALELLSELNHTDGLMSQPRSRLYHRISEVADADTVRNFVIQRLRLRKARLSASPQM